MEYPCRYDPLRLNSRRPIYSWLLVENISRGWLGVYEDLEEWPNICIGLWIYLDGKVVDCMVTALFNYWCPNLRVCDLELEILG